jgi:hypothetical protein
LAVGLPERGQPVHPAYGHRPLIQVITPGGATTRLGNLSLLGLLHQLQLQLHLRVHREEHLRWLRRVLGRPWVVLLLLLMLLLVLLVLLMLLLLLLVLLVLVLLLLLLLKLCRILRAQLGHGHRLLLCLLYRLLRLTRSRSEVLCGGVLTLAICVRHGGA